MAEDAENHEETMRALRALPPEERRALCERVVANLSDLVEGTADQDLCREVEELLGRCRPYLGVRDTLEATILALGELGREAPAKDDSFRRCVEAARRRLVEGEGDRPGRRSS